MCKEVSMEPKNCLECNNDKACSSWYGGSMCTEVPEREADDEPIEEWGDLFCLQLTFQAKL